MILRPFFNRTKAIFSRIIRRYGHVSEWSVHSGLKNVSDLISEFLKQVFSSINLVGDLIEYARKKEPDVH